MTSKLAAFLTILVSASAVAWAGNSNSLMDISQDNRWLACSNRDSGTVSLVDLQSMQKIHEITVGTKPEGVSFIGQTHRLATAVYGEDKVVIIDSDLGEVIGEVSVFDEPYGVVNDGSDERVFVTLDYPGRVVEINTQQLKVVRQAEVGQFIRGIAFSPTSSRLFVTEYYTANVKALELDNLTVIDSWKGASTDNLARQLALNPRRPKAYVPNIRSRVTANHGQGSIFPYVSVIDTDPGEGKRRTRIPMDAFVGNLVTANPWEIAITPDGRQLFVIFGGTNDMFACTVVDDDYREIENRKYMRVGANPRAVRISPDGNKLFVYNALDFNVVVYAIDSLQQTATIEITNNPLDRQVWEGKRLFYSALQPMVGRRWISCSSCHPDGEPDGRTWHNPEGLRNTQSLGGMAWTHPIHWSADRDEVQDFEHTIRGPLMQGRGLIRGQVADSLASPNKGRSAALDALTAYSNSHNLTLSPHARGGLNPQAQRGREIFFSKETQCATCHHGPFFTDSQPAEAAAITRHDVGTGHDDPGEKMGPAYDTPSLLGIYRTAPYLHHGTAATLLDVLTTQNKGDRHGKTSHLSQEQLTCLVEFLKALPYEDPEPLAKRQGLRRIDD